MVRKFNKNPSENVIKIQPYYPLEALANNYSCTLLALPFVNSTTATLPEVADVLLAAVAVAVVVVVVVGVRYTMLARHVLSIFLVSATHSCLAVLEHYSTVPVYRCTGYQAGRTSSRITRPYLSRKFGRITEYRLPAVKYEENIKLQFTRMYQYGTGTVSRFKI